MVTAEKDVDDEDPFRDVVLGEEVIEGGSDPYGNSYEGGLTPEDLAIFDETVEALKALEAMDPTEVARIRAQLVALLEQALPLAKKICEPHIDTFIQAALEHLRR